jgi:hypothetical protein
VNIHACDAQPHALRPALRLYDDMPALVCALPREGVEVQQLPLKLFTAE